MARIPPADPANPEIASGLVANVRARRGGALTALDLLLLHDEAAAQGWNAMFGALASDTSIGQRIREIAVLRVAYLTNARYPLHQHRRIAAEAGLTDCEIDAIREWQASGLFDPREQAVLAYADAMTRTVQVPEETFRAVCAHLDHRQLVGLTAIIAAYNMAARFMEALELTPADMGTGT